MALFQKAVHGLLNREGGYVNNPNDAGGETKYGISKRSYPGLDIEHLTVSDARDIYCVDFWEPLNCNHMTSQQVANVVLDFAANTGVKRSAKTLQKILGVAVDGYIGPVTLAALNAECAKRWL